MRGTILIPLVNSYGTKAIPALILLSKTKPHHLYSQKLKPIDHLTILTEHPHRDQTFHVTCETWQKPHAREGTYMFMHEQKKKQKQDFKQT